MNMKKERIEINPWYISGLTQSDGSFFSIVSVSSNNNISIRPKFVITADLDSINVLEIIKNYFNCGVITKNYKTYSAELVISKRSDLK